MADFTLMHICYLSYSHEEGGGAWSGGSPGEQPQQLLQHQHRSTTELLGLRSYV